MKALLSYRFTVLVLLLFSFNAIGQSARFYYFIDSSSRYSIEDTAKFSWKPGALSDNISFGYNENMTVWCKLTLADSRLNSDLRWAFNNIHLDSLTIYPYNGEPINAGDRAKGKSVHLNAYSFKIPEVEVQSTVIARVKKQWSFFDFSVSLTQERDLLETTQNSLALFFIFSGFAIMLLLLNFYIYRQTHERKYLYYIVYSLIGVIYVAVNMGVAKNFFFPDFLYFSEFRIFSGCYWYLFLGIFIADLLDLKTGVRTIYRLIMSFQWVVGILSAFSIICLILKEYEWLLLPSYITYLIFFLNILLLILGVYYSVKLKHPNVKYVIYSFFPHILWGLHMILNSFQIIEVDLSKNWISLIILYEMMLFGGLLIRDYVDAFKRNLILQEQLLLEESNAIIAIDHARIKERRLLSDILHDKIGVLIARTMHLLELKRNQDTKESLIEIGAYIRSLSHTIMPISLEEGALKGALLDQVNFMREQIKPVQLDYQTYDFPDRIQKDVASCLYLISMELLQNALKHGNPQLIKLELFWYKEEMVLSCDDDGNGFLETEVKGFGLKNIERRIRFFSGTMNISASPGDGSTILIIIPHLGNH